MAGTQAKPGSGFSVSKKIGAAKVRETSTIEDFVIGYRNREDTSLLKPQTLVSGSHDVLTDVSGRVNSRKGYILDGPGSDVQAPIQGFFTWQTQNGFLHNLRAGFLTDGTNGKLQIRYVDSNGVISWLDLLTGLSSTLFNYTNFWDSTRVHAFLLFVNGSQGIWEWSGGIGTVASSAPNSITLNGTKTLAQLGFTTAGGSVIVNGITYDYTGTTGQTFNGVTPVPATITAGTVAYQAPVFTAVGSMTFTNTPTPPTDFTFDLIAELQNQVYFASTSSNLLYLSIAGTYKDYSQSTARLQYEGDQLTTKGTLKALIPEDKQLYVSAGLDEWYFTNFTDTTITNQLSGTTATYETAELQAVKTTQGQATQSQYMTTKIKNSIVYVSNEPILNSLGQVADYLSQPVVDDLSYSIVNDMNQYDFTDASVFYNKQFIFLAVPKEGLFRMYNMTNPKNPYWETPISIPLSGFSFDGNTLIGHSYLTSESYQLFTGLSDRAADANSTGLPISCKALFAFQESGLRAKRKSFNKFFTEGYMNQNTAITIGLVFRSPNAGIMPGQTLILNGDAKYVLKQGDNSLGKFPLGEAPLGTDTIIAMQNTLPNYFAVFKTANRYPYLAYQPSFSSYGVNQQWSLLSFGNNAAPASENETDITY